MASLAQVHEDPLIWAGGYGTIATGERALEAYSSDMGIVVGQSFHYWIADCTQKTLGAEFKGTRVSQLLPGYNDFGF